MVEAGHYFVAGLKPAPAAPPPPAKVAHFGAAKPPPDPQLKKLDTLSSIDARLADLGLAN